MDLPRPAARLLRELAALAGPEWRRVEGGLLAPEWVAAGGTERSPAPAGAALRATPGKQSFRAHLPRGLACLVKRHEPEARRGRASRPPALAALAEALFALRLAAAGIRVPRPLAACRAGESSWVALELVAHRGSLEEALLRDPEHVRRRLPEIARLLAQLHRAGFHHRDFYLCHLLEEEGTGALVLIDLERVGELGARARRWRAKDLGALVFSLRPGLAHTSALRFLARYARELELGRAAARRLAAAALRVAARIARHRPRHGAPPLGLAR
ncbi:MAG: hypothetical protein JNM84_02725 [Planctomycetes bacterium]|nr:hypothetical protein [Planctomycetota bacterium]